jgi:alkyl hydroperoxide reductase subunit F
MANLRETFPEIENSGVEREGSKPSSRYDVAIIGGGPAAISAAIYTARKGLEVILVAEKLGGQVAETVGIENMISIPATTGPKLTSDLKRHVEQYSLKIREGLSVQELQPGKIKRIKLDTDEIIEAVSVIVATGANWRQLNIPGEKQNIGSGVAYCPHCDGPFFQDKDVAVVGGGNSGVEAALDLSGIVKTVTLLEYMPILKADTILVDRATSKNNIRILTNVECLEVLSDSSSVSGLRYRDRTTEEHKTLQLDGIFVQIGLLPNSQFLSDVVKLNPHGEIEINRRGETSSEGIFACGDVTDVPYKQIIIAMGEGANVGLTTSEYVAAQATVFEEKW